ncbi:hypothetical protein [Nonomuraea sp. NPDC049028]|uniref:hypothetical protein n=1 Tax=Nonomuraea sp. NPDC049028 TaxID=3364348 RepID=UPI0037106F82
MAVLLAGILMAAMLAGCQFLSSETNCRQEARRQASELKDAVSGLVPASIAATVEELDGCDSGDEGGWLSFTVYRAVDGEALIHKFVEGGWKPIADLQKRDECPKCIAGATARINGRSIEVAFMETQESSVFDIIIEFAP